MAAVQKFSDSSLKEMEKWSQREKETDDYASTMLEEVDVLLLVALTSYSNQSFRFYSHTRTCTSTLTHTATHIFEADFLEHVRVCAGALVV